MLLNSIQLRRKWIRWFFVFCKYLLDGNFRKVNWQSLTNGFEQYNPLFSKWTFMRNPSVLFVQLIMHMHCSQNLITSDRLSKLVWEDSPTLTQCLLNHSCCQLCSHIEVVALAKMLDVGSGYQAIIIRVHCGN